MKRREFIKKTSAAMALTAVGNLGLTSFSLDSKTKQITILHTNDVHSHMDSFASNSGKYANQGGIAKRATLISKIRQENPNTLLLDAGDMFQGTPYFNFYGGALEFKLMSKLKYDAATLGNHDFDNGIEGLYAQLPHANFSFLSANYDFKNTVLNSHIKPYKIFLKEGLKIGVFGIGIKLDGLVTKKLYKETQYLDPIEMAQEMTNTLKKVERCDLVICLSHLGYHYKNEQKISDLTLAKTTQDIDLIIGGHTHTFLPKPTVIKNNIGNNVLINQVGCYGINLGRIDFYLEANRHKTAKGTSIIV